MFVPKLRFVTSKGLLHFGQSKERIFLSLIDIGEPPLNRGICGTSLIYNPFGCFVVLMAN